MSNDVNDNIMPIARHIRIVFILSGLVATIAFCQGIVNSLDMFCLKVEAADADDRWLIARPAVDNFMNMKITGIFDPPVLPVASHTSTFSITQSYECVAADRCPDYLDPLDVILDSQYPPEIREKIGDMQHSEWLSLVQEDVITEEIRIQSIEDISATRDSLIDYIWEGEGWPTRSDVIVISDLYDEQYASIFNSTGNLDRIDCYTVLMPYGFESQMYHFHPIAGNGDLFIYHAGHGYGFKWEDRSVNNAGNKPGLVIPHLIREGYSVLAISMPLEGNNHPIVYVPDVGYVYMTYHYQMFQYLPKPFSFFIEPIVVTLNYLDENYSYENIHMIGLSGGGWTTTVYPALDMRIKKCYPVAGSIPIPWRWYRDMGDIEQNEIGFYSIANYSELYLMASHGIDRGQTQILNYYDSCCFGGWSLPHGWVDTVRTAVDNLGEGQYDYYLDYTHKSHKISSHALSIVLKSVPEIIEIVPQSTFAFNQAMSLTVTGTNFYHDSIVQWNGEVRATHYVSDIQLQAEILATDLYTPGTFTVTVFNPPLAGGLSNIAYFEVLTKPISVYLPTVFSLP